MRIIDKSIQDRLRPGLPTTASGVAQQGTCGNYYTAKQSENKRRKRGRRRVKRQRDVWKGRRLLIRVGTLNIGTMIGSAKRAGRLYRAKECRHIVPTGNKMKRE